MQKRIALLYSTTEGQTRKVAEYLAGRLRAAGDDVALMHVAELPLDWVPDNSDAYLVAASVHQAKVQPAMEAFLAQHAAALNKRPCALALLSLNAALGDEADQNPQTYAEALFEATGWLPGHVEHVAGALRYREYNWLMRIVMKRIASKMGISTDTARDVEYTDWDALDRFAERFRGMVREG